MTNGAVVLSSNYSCLPEILKDCAIYFNPKDESDFNDKLSQILGNNDLKQDLRAKSQELLKNYSWEKMAEQTLEIYN